MNFMNMSSALAKVTLLQITISSGKETFFLKTTASNEKRKGKFARASNDKHNVY